MATWLLVLASILIGLPRVLGVTQIAYQAIAHLWVGGLFGAYAVARKTVHVACAIGLTILEVACFLYFRATGSP